MTINKVVNLPYTKKKIEIEEKLPNIQEIIEGEMKD